MNTVKVRNLELGNGIPAICIPNVGKTKEDILSLTRTYLGMHMDLMEWRMDWYEDVEDIAKVSELVKELRDVMGDTPLLCTFRTDKEGGVHPMSTEKYAELNKAVAATGNADIIDVEIFTGDDIVREMIDASTLPVQRSLPLIMILTKHLPNLISFTVSAKCRIWAEYS